MLKIFLMPFMLNSFLHKVFPFLHLLNLSIYFSTFTIYVNCF